MGAASTEFRMGYDLTFAYFIYGTYSFDQWDQLAY